MHGSRWRALETERPDGDGPAACGLCPVGLRNPRRCQITATAPALDPTLPVPPSGFPAPGGFIGSFELVGPRRPAPRRRLTRRGPTKVVAGGVGLSAAAGAPARAGNRAGTPVPPAIHSLGAGT